MIKIFGQPSTKGMTDENFGYILKELEQEALFKIRKKLFKKNNVLVLEFNKYGIFKKKFYDKE